MIKFRHDNQDYFLYDLADGRRRLYRNRELIAIQQAAIQENDAVSIDSWQNLAHLSSDLLDMLTKMEDANSFEVLPSDQYLYEKGDDSIEVLHIHSMMFVNETYGGLDFTPIVDLSSSFYITCTTNRGLEAIYWDVNGIFFDVEISTAFRPQLISGGIVVRNAQYLRSAVRNYLEANMAAEEWALLA